MSKKIKGHRKSLGGFSVTRFFPNADKKMVGPFIFIDQMGPANFPAGEGMDVRPHPHIGLSTISYLFEGSMLHRDSLGNNIEIVAGDVNWMTAGRGIVHSEREAIEVRSIEHSMNGLQCWVALPEEFAELRPSFTHIKRCQLPHHMLDGVILRLIAGEAYGMSSLIKTYSPMFYVDAVIPEGKTLRRPNPDHECLCFVVSGEALIDGSCYKLGEAALLGPDAEICAKTNNRIILLGGKAWEKTPHIDWNFVSFSRDRIEKAKSDWAQKLFPNIPGDNEESIPLP